MATFFERIESEGLGHYSYIVGDKNDAVIIDPRRDVDGYVNKTARQGMRITAILETHRNEDYVTGSLELQSRTGAEIWYADRQWPCRYGQPVEDGQEWKVGGLRLRAILSPGHTPGSMSYLLDEKGGSPWMLFSGDALFAGEVGRVDLMGTEKIEEMAGLLYETLFGKLLPLGDGVILCPAHGSGSVCGSSFADRPWTTLGIEKQLNPALQHRDQRAFIEAVGKKLERPPYFKQMEKLNREGAPILGPLPTPPPLSSAAFAAQIDEATILDTRDTLSFSAAHIPGALSIWPGGLAGFAGWFLPYDQGILLVTDEEDPSRMVRILIRLGYDDLRGFLSGGMLAWHTSGKESFSYETVTTQELCRRIDEQEVTLLDVRSPDELDQEGRIRGAIHIHITQLPARLDEVPTGSRIHIFCGSGMRSALDASLLKWGGWPEVTVVKGGLSGWNSTNCPLENPLKQPAGAAP